MANKGKKLRDHYKNTDRDKLFNLNEAVKLAVSYTHLTLPTKNEV